LLAALQAENHGKSITAGNIIACRQFYACIRKIFYSPPFSDKFFLELFSGEWTENNSNN